MQVSERAGLQEDSADAICEEGGEGGLLGGGLKLDRR